MRAVFWAHHGGPGGHEAKRTVGAVAAVAAAGAVVGLVADVAAAVPVVRRVKQLSHTRFSWEGVTAATHGPGGADGASEGRGRARGSPIGPGRTFSAANVGKTARCVEQSAQTTMPHDLARRPEKAAGRGP